MFPIEWILKTAVVNYTKNCSIGEAAVVHNVKNSGPGKAAVVKNIKKKNDGTEKSYL